MIIIDASPSSVELYPANCIPLDSWLGDPHDCELLNLIPVLEELSKVKDVQGVISRILTKMTIQHEVDTVKLNQKLDQ